MKSIETLKRIIAYKYTPVKKGSIVFTSFSGHYSDSPKYICDAIHRENGALDLVWLLKPELAKDLPDYIRWIDISSKEAQHARSCAEAIVDNVYCDRAFSVMNDTFINNVKKHMIAFFSDKKDQLAVTTFHCTPLKKLGRDQVGNNISDFVCPGTTMIVGNQFSADVIDHVTFQKLNMMVMGMPRNDPLFSPEKAAVYKEKLDLPAGKKIVLFAPTFRNDGPDVEGKNVCRSGIDQLEEMDFEKLFSALNRKFGGEWVLVCRFHYHVEQLVDWDSLNKRFNGQIINGNSHDDMAEYLSCTDVLITDSSSCMFDFMLKKKPCFLFFPDYENYRDKERGFYLPVETLPFPLALSFNSLLEKILDFNSDEYVRSVDELTGKLGCMEDGHASERIAHFILNELGYADKEGN